MQIPASFQRQLTAEFDGQIRARWVEWKGRFVIERKRDRGRSASPNLPKIKGGIPARLEKAYLQFMAEAKVRCLEGYQPIFELAPGTTTECPKCGQKMKLAYMSWQAAMCPLKHETHIYHWPLSDGVLQRLRFLDPDRGGIERVEREVLEDEVAREVGLQKKTASERADINADLFTQIADIQSVGYTGKEQAWNTTL